MLNQNYQVIMKSHLPQDKIFISEYVLMNFIPGKLSELIYFT